MIRNFFASVRCPGLRPLQQSRPKTLVHRLYSNGPGRGPVGDQNAKRMQSTVYYFGATAVLTLGLSYAAVPLYRMFCQASGYGGTTSAQHDGSKVEEMNVKRERQFKIKFNADTGASMRWNFRPQQGEIKVLLLNETSYNLPFNFVFSLLVVCRRDRLGLLHCQEPNK